MITFGVDNLQASTVTTPAPIWMKSERYDYCEPLFAGRSTAENSKKKFSQFNKLLSFFL